MFEFLSAWWAARCAAARKREYDRGYAWAVEELRQGTPVDELYQQLDNPFDDGPFDYGARAALFAVREQRYGTS